MNLPNKLTVLRILLVPVFVVFLYIRKDVYQYIAVAIFIAASFTDLLDGRIARSRNMITDFGKFLDPIADKLLVMSALVMLVCQLKMPAWVCIIMLAREFIVTGLRLVASTNGKVIAAGIWGKLKTVSQMIFIPMAIVFIPFRSEYYLNHPLSIHSPQNFMEWLTVIMMFVSAALTLWSGVLYLWENRALIKDM